MIHITIKTYSVPVRHTSHPSEFVNNFSSYPANKQTNKHWVKQNLLGRG